MIGSTKSGWRRFRLSRSLACSLGLHALLVALVSLKSCGNDALPVATPIGRPLVVEVASFGHLLQPAGTQPGGGVPAPHINRSPVRKPPAHRAPERLAEETTPKATAPPRDEKPSEAEAPVSEPEDVISAPSRVNKGPPSGLPADGAPAGSGWGSRGGPGGPGEGGVPLVSGKFAFGSDTRAAFKGVVCFIPPGTLRIADVHGCDPVGIFYTNTFAVLERQQGEGFPGITDRSTWFMIEYTGGFTVARGGTYEFRLHSDDGSYLFIDGTQVIENDGKHQPTSRSGSISLRAGLHQLRLLYGQTTDRMALLLFVRAPGASVEHLFTPRI